MGIASTALAVGNACSGPAPEPASDEPTRVQVVASVERQSNSTQAGGDDLNVLLSVLRIPHSVNAERLLRLMGLRADIPPRGTCEVIDLSNRASPALSSLERIEFLDVGDVTATSGKRSARLLRQAFPTVTDFIAGVVYTSRDKNGDLLPLDQTLAIRARGAGKLKTFTLEVTDRPRLERVSIDSVPLSNVYRLPVVNSFELRWAPGNPGDVLWLEFGASYGHKVVSCAYDDAQGYAKVPGGMTDEVGETRFTLHRLYHSRIQLPGFDAAEIQFDSRITQPVILY